MAAQQTPIQGKWAFPAAHSKYRPSWMCHSYHMRPKDHFITQKMCRANNDKVCLIDWACRCWPLSAKPVWCQPFTSEQFKSIALSTSYLFCHLTSSFASAPFMGLKQHNESCSNSSPHWQKERYFDLLVYRVLGTLRLQIRHSLRVFSVLSVKWPF